eukprot:1389625-Amphidinium_carterae.1
MGGGVLSCRSRARLSSVTYCGAVVVLHGTLVLGQGQINFESVPVAFRLDRMMNDVAVVSILVPMCARGPAAHVAKIWGDRASREAAERIPGHYAICTQEGMVYCE